MYIPRNWEFGSAFENFRYFTGGGGVGVDTPKPPFGTPWLLVQQRKLCWVYLAIGNFYILQNELSTFQLTLVE
jgi:hypothetical protein